MDAVETDHAGLHHAGKSSGGALQTRIKETGRDGEGGGDATIPRAREGRLRGGNDLT